MKFNIGDTVTNNCGTYEVIRVYDDEFIRVRVLEHINPL